MRVKLVILRPVLAKYHDSYAENNAYLGLHWIRIAMLLLLLSFTSFISFMVWDVDEHAIF